MKAEAHASAFFMGEENPAWMINLKGINVRDLMVFLSLLVLMLSVQAHSGIYKWVDEKGDAHFSDVPFEKDSAQKITVDTRGSSYGNKASRKKERDAIRGINAQKRISKRNSSKFPSLKGGKSEDPSQSSACISAKKRLKKLQEKMKRGYTATQSNYYRSKKRDLSEKERNACRPKKSR